MKNIAHFATGLVAASFVPGVMELAAQGSLLIALGGACAMLPDVLDFRLLRYLQRRDVNIAPDPAQPDPQPIAEAIATQIRQAVLDGRPHVVQLYPARKSAAEWVSYTVIFDVAHSEVVVRMDEGGAEARAHAGPMVDPYDNPLRVDELGGPTLAFHPMHTAQDEPVPGNGVLQSTVSTHTGNPEPSSTSLCSQTCVRVDFLPWHRQWTHSLLVALCLGLLAGWLIEPLAGIVATLGYAAHVLVDAAGHMGVNLFAPLTHRRSTGLKLYHSGDWIPNLVVVWASLTLVLLNIDHARDLPLIAVGPYLAFVVFLPSVGLAAL
jgi:LexA-binding, inner membrane-associated putative hydrolase